MSSDTGGSGKPAAAMEEVLSSIKQIIEEDKASHTASAPKASHDEEEALELTELAEDHSEEPAPITSIFQKRPPVQPVPTPAKEESEEAEPSGPAVVAQLRGLREAAKIAKGISADEAGGDSRLEPYIAKAIQPIVESWAQQNLPRLAQVHIDAALGIALKDWMDRNLEAVVERVVREEVSRLVAQAGED